MCFFILYCKLFKYKYAVSVANDEAQMPEYNINNDIYNRVVREKTIVQLKVILKESRFAYIR